MTPAADPARSWTSDRVLDAAGAWVWVPPGASEARTPEYHLVVYPPALLVPAHVAWCRSARPAAAVLDETVGIAGAWGLSELSFWVGARTTPADLADHLRDRGAVHAESVEVLSLPLDGTSLAEVGLEPVARAGTVEVGGIEVRQVLDPATLADADRVAGEVWGDRPRGAEEAEQALAELTDPEATEVRVVAYVGGEPASAAGATLALDAHGGSVARLWGAATRPAFRGRGAYRATVGARLRLAQQRGAALAVVKAVTTTSAPIVRRLGFTGHGVEDRLRLTIPPLTTPADDRG